MGEISFHTPGMSGPFTDRNSLGNWATDWTQLRYLPDEHVWFLSCIANGYEVCIAGDASRPDPGRLAVAQTVTGRMSELMEKVLNFLDGSLDHYTIGSSGTWHLEGINFGFDRNQPLQVFDVVLTTDEYGDWNDCESWYVTCNLEKNGKFEICGQCGGWYGRKVTRKKDGRE